LRIAPPEAPHTGYLYGKGLYFSDRSGTSAGYTCPYLSNNIGTYILGEVALGKTYSGGP